MAQQLKEWSSSRNNQILSVINGKEDRSAQEVNVKVIEYILPSNETLKLEVHSRVKFQVEHSLSSRKKWFDDWKLRKDVFEKFINLLKSNMERLVMIETISSQMTIVNVRRRMKVFLEKLEHISDVGILRNNLIKESLSIALKIDYAQTALIKLINRALSWMAIGNSIDLLVSPESALITSYIVDLLDKSGLEPGVVNMVLTDKEPPKENKSNFPVVVVFDSSDIMSAIGRSIEACNRHAVTGVNIFVQQSVYTKFVARMKDQMKKLLKVGQQFDESSDVTNEVVVDYEAIDIENAITNPGIKIFQFRSNSEALTLVNHLTKVLCMSIWGDTSLALEFAKKITCTLNVSINGFGNGLVKANPFKLWLANTNCKVDFSKKELKDLHPSIETAIKANEKWKALSSSDRKLILTKISLEHNNAIGKVLRSNEKVKCMKFPSGEKIFLTSSQPIGIVFLKVNEKSKDIWKSIVSSLQVGNCVVILKNGQSKEWQCIQDSISSFEKHGLMKGALQVIDFNNNSLLSDQLSKVVFNDEIIGVCVEHECFNDKDFANKKVITFQLGEMSFA